MKRTGRRLLFSVLSVGILLVLAELGVRAAYWLRWSGSRAQKSPVIWLPETVRENPKFAPSFANLNNPWTQYRQLLREDREFLWALKPRAWRRYVDITAPQVVRDGPPGSLGVFDVRTNAEGFRGEDFSRNKTPGTFRIVCLGDSYTFGFSVNAEDSYPARLLDHLNRAYPGKRFEVLNCGVPGYTSYQGLKLVRRKILSYDADLLVIGFGFNDGSSEMRARSDKAYDESTAKVYKDLVNRSQLYKLYRHVLFRAWLRSSGARGPVVPENASNRVSPGEYAGNLSTIIKEAREHGIEPILFNHYPIIFKVSPYFIQLNLTSMMTKTPLVDPWREMEARQRTIWSDVEKNLSLTVQPRPIPESIQLPDSMPTRSRAMFPAIFRLNFPPGPIEPSENVGVVFRLVGIAGGLRFSPAMRLDLNDAGTDGDERAGDRVYSGSINLRPAFEVVYFFINGDTSGLEEKPGAVRDILSDMSYLSFPGGDVPVLNVYFVDAPPENGVLYFPINTFGTSYMYKDIGHFNAVANEELARALFRAIDGNKKARAFIQAN